MAKNGDRALLCLDSRLATVVSEAVSEMKFQVLEIKKKIIWSLVSVVLFLMLYFMLDELILFCKGDFCGIRYL